MSFKFWLRIVVDCLVILLIAWAPWWLVCLVVVFALVYFDWYIEALFAGFFLDALYGIGGITNWIFSLSSAMAVIVLLYAKQWIKIDSSL